MTPPRTEVVLDLDTLTTSNHLSNGEAVFRATVLVVAPGNVGMRSAELRAWLPRERWEQAGRPTSIPVDVEGRA